MRQIIVTMKDGTIRDFQEQGRCGGSYTLRLKTVGAFAVVVDEWDHETWIPSDDIALITTDPGRSY